MLQRWSRAAGRDKVQVETWMPSQQGPQVGVLVRRVIVVDQVQIELRRLLVDPLQELKPLLTASSFQAHSDHAAFEQFELAHPM